MRRQMAMTTGRLISVQQLTDEGFVCVLLPGHDVHAIGEEHVALIR